MQKKYRRKYKNKLRLKKVMVKPNKLLFKKVRNTMKNYIPMHEKENKNEKSKNENFISMIENYQPYIKKAINLLSFGISLKSMYNSMNPQSNQLELPGN